MANKVMRGRGKAWTDHEIGALLLGIKNHTPLSQIGRFLGRTEAGVLRRLNEHHRDEWRESEHPQCHPWKSEGKARAAAEREAQALRVVPDAEPAADVGPPPWAAEILDRLEAISARLDRLEQAWGIGA